MKKRKIFAVSCLLLLFMFIFPLSKAWAKAKMTSTGPSAMTDQLETAGESVLTFYLPTSLVWIGDEAFNGIASSYFGPVSAAEDSERMINGVYVWIPPSVSHIGESAFSNVKDLRIVASRDCYAQKWAIEQGLQFVDEAIAPVPISQVLSIMRYALFFILLFCFLPVDSQEYSRMAFRMNEEIYLYQKVCPAMRVLELDYP